MKLPKKRYLIGVPLVLLVAFGIYKGTRPKVTTYETEAIGRGPVVHEVSVTGSVAPFKKIALQPEVSGRVAKIYVTEGAEVKAGDPLIDIDSRDVSARVASQQAAVASAKARLDELVAGATPQELAQAQAAVTSAETRLAAAKQAKVDAQTSLDNALAKASSQGSGKLESLLLAYADAVTAARDAVERHTSAMFTTDNFLTFQTISAIDEQNARSSRAVAKGALTDVTNAVAAANVDHDAAGALSAYARVAGDLAAVKAHLEADRTVLGFTSGLSSGTIAQYQASVGAALAALDGALQSTQGAKSSLELQVNLNDAETQAAKAALSTATFAVTSAENTLASARADFDLRKTGSRAEVLAAARAGVQAQQATLDGLYADLAKRRIFAPLDATVTNVAINLGETAQPGRTAVELNSHGQFEIVANVSEVDIARVQVGQPTEITLDAFPSSEKWTGKVSFVDPAEKVVEGVIFYETKFVFDHEDARIRSGMTANLSVETARADDALRVPLRALVERDDKQYVRVMKADGKPEEREVKLGVENNQYSEVVEGVTEGEKVVVNETTK